MPDDGKGLFQDDAGTEQFYNPGQNIWQNCNFLPFPQISMLFASMQRFRRDISTENDNIDIGGGMSTTMISFKLVNAHIPRQRRKKDIKKHDEVGIAKLFCPIL
jgi:hypothetical protein